MTNFDIIWRRLLAIVLLFALLILGRFSAQGKSINQNGVAHEACAVQGISTR